MILYTIGLQNLISLETITVDISGVAGRKRCKPHKSLDSNSVCSLTSLQHVVEGMVLEFTSGFCCSPPLPPPPKHTHSPCYVLSYLFNNICASGGGIAEEIKKLTYLLTLNVFLLNQGVFFCTGNDGIPPVACRRLCHQITEITTRTL